MSREERGEGSMQPMEAAPLHREQLEQRLLAAYDRRYQGIACHPRLRRARSSQARLAAIGIIAIGIVAASRAPAGYSVDLGQSIELRAAPGTALPQGRALEALIENGLDEEAHDAQPPREIALQLLRDDHGDQILHVTVWGAPIASVVERLRARVPELARVELSAHILAGRVHTNLAGLFAHRFLHLHDAASIAAARRALEAELAAEGDSGKVDVQLDETGDGRTRIRVLKERSEAMVLDSADIIDMIESCRLAPIEFVCSISIARWCARPSPARSRPPSRSCSSLSARR